MTYYIKKYIFSTKNVLIFSSISGLSIDKNIDNMKKKIFPDIDETEKQLQSITLCKQ